MNTKYWLKVCDEIGKKVYSEIKKVTKDGREKVMGRGFGGDKTLLMDDKIESIAIDVFEKTGNGNYNPYVQYGDVIYIPKMQKSVIVKGAVYGKELKTEPRIKSFETAYTMKKISEDFYELVDGERVSDLLAKAHGVTPRADLQSAYVERNGKQINVNLYDVLVNDASTLNIMLENNDVLVVPATNACVYVEGQVVNPGPFDYQPNLKANDYIGLAGGPLVEANMGGAYIVRGKKRLSVRKNPVIEQGDRIYVPRQIFRFWQDYVEIASVAATILISYLTLRITATR